MSDEEKTSSTPSTQLEKLPAWGGRSRQKKHRRPSGSQSSEDGFQKVVLKAGRSVKTGGWWLIGVIVLGIAALLGGIALYAHFKSVRAEQTRLLDEVVANAARAQIMDAHAIPENLAVIPFPIFTDASAQEEAITKALVELQEKAQGSQSELLSQLVQGAQLVRTSEFQTATELYRSVLEQLPKDHPLRFLAQEGLGIALEGQGMLEEALQEFELLAGSKGSFYRDMALWHQGRILEQLGREDDAIAIYKQYQEEFPIDQGSALAGEEVRARLSKLAPDALEKPAEVGIPNLPPSAP